VLSKVLPTSRCRIYALWFHWYMHICIEFSVNFKRGRGQIVFTISQTFFERLNFEQPFFKNVFLRNSFLQSFMKDDLCKVSRRSARDRNPSRPRLQTTGLETETKSRDSITGFRTTSLIR